ncbi:unnamed protein product [Meganyctiphanes norvegica]|uniref:Uncharacterized protein n=1 Tax=Meganyctiphanes norvegica TaxID=48144 RepID=A0AAV2QC56_MEGNR
MVQFAGKYVHDKDENFEAFLEKMDFTSDKRKAALDSKPEHVVTVDGDAWTLSSKYSTRTSVSAFKLNQATEVEGGSEGKSKVIFKLDGNTLHQEGLESNSTLIVDRLFDENGMKMVLKHKPSNTTATRYFKRV